MDGWTDEFFEWLINWNVEIRDEWMNELMNEQTN